MGVNGLWKIMQPTCEQTTMHDILKQHIVDNRESEIGYVLGIDASIWLVSSQFAARHCHAQAGENPELRTLFYRLARLAAHPVAIVFVFDGPSRPSVKRGTRVVPKAHFLTVGFQELIRAFGFTVHEAPGEAEAELALMNSIGAIDAIITDDSDVFVFGARVVIRNSNIKRDEDQIQVYRMAAAMRSPSNKLSTAGALLIAVLCGGDYDSAGLKGCGVHTAHALARYGLGETLLAAYSRHGAAQRDALDVWRTSLANTIQNDPKGFIGRCFRGLALSIPPTFPSLALLELYLHPVVSDRSKFSVQMYRFRSHLPSIKYLDIARICELRFSWGTHTEILAKFDKMVWPAVALRALVQDITIKQGFSEPCADRDGSTHYMILPKGKRDHKKSTRTVTMEAAPLLGAVSAALRGLRAETSRTEGVQSPQPPPIVVTVPGYMVEILDSATPSDTIRCESGSSDPPSRALKRSISRADLDSESTDVANLHLPLGRPHRKLKCVAALDTSIDLTGESSNSVALTVPPHVIGSVIDLTL